MEAIKVIVTIIAVFSAFTLWACLIMLCVKKWRQKGKRIFLYSILGVIIAPAIGIWIDSVEQKQAQVDKQARLEELARKAGYANYAEQLAALELEKQEAEKRRRKTQDKLAREAGFKDYEDQQRAERIAKEQAEQEARIKALNGFPDEQTQASAKALGISRYAVYKLLEDQDTISRYCDYNTQSYALEKAKQTEMDATSDDVKQTEIWNRFETKQQELLASYNTELGLIDFELNDLSIAGHWLFYCRAAEQNWSVVTEAQAKAATRSDAKEAKEALNAFYLLNLNEETSPFFSKQRYSTVSCEWENHNDMRFVGCQLISFSFKSNWQMFVVGRLSNGNLAVSPINGDTSSKLDISQARFYDERNGKHIFIQAYEQPRAYLARYAGTRIDIKAVRGLFE